MHLLAVMFSAQDSLFLNIFIATVNAAISNIQGYNYYCYLCMPFILNCKPFWVGIPHSPSSHLPQGKGLFQHHQPGPATPVSSQGPDRLSYPEHSLHHPGHLPAFHWPAQQEAQTLSGAQKFQRQLQHTGKHFVKCCCYGLTVRKCLYGVWMCAQQLQSLVVNM